MRFVIVSNEEGLNPKKSFENIDLYLGKKKNECC
jgi:hypothetical protein